MCDGAGHLAVMQRMNGLSTLMTYPLPENGQPLTTLDEGRTLAFEEESYSLDFGKQGPLDSLVIRVVYSSLVTPESTYDINVMTGMSPIRYPADKACIQHQKKSWTTCRQPDVPKCLHQSVFTKFWIGCYRSKLCGTGNSQAQRYLVRHAGRRLLKKQKDVLGGFDKEQYRTFRLWAQSEGGVQVPVSVVHRKGSVRLDGSDPLLLYAYGAYGAAQDAKFDSKRLSLLDRSGPIHCWCLLAIL